MGILTLVVAVVGVGEEVVVCILSYICVWYVLFVMEKCQYICNILIKLCN